MSDVTEADASDGPEGATRRPTGEPITSTALSVAVTGGIGAGKSTVSSSLALRGATVIDSDRLAREVVAPGTAGLAAVAEAFGTEVIGADGSVDRGALAQIVFGDPLARSRLEDITHPLVRKLFAERLAQAPRDGVVVNDIPLIRTVPEAARYHLVIGVGVSDGDLRIRRLVARGHSEADARARIGAQISDDQRQALADVWLANSGPKTDLDGPIDRLWQRLTTFAANRLTKVEAPPEAKVLVPPDPEWPQRAALLAARVSLACGDARVDHIGSTSIPGLAAKDVIDLQLTVDSLDHADALEPALAAAGFPRSPRDRHDTPHSPATDPLCWQKRVHGNADPGQGVTLYLRVRDWG